MPARPCRRRPPAPLRLYRAPAARRRARRARAAGCGSPGSGRRARPAARPSAPPPPPGPVRPLTIRATGLTAAGSPVCVRLRAVLRAEHRQRTDQHKPSPGADHIASEPASGGRNTRASALAGTWKCGVRARPPDQHHWRSRGGRWCWRPSVGRPRGLEGERPPLRSVTIAGWARAVWAAVTRAWGWGSAGRPRPYW